MPLEILPGLSIPDAELTESFVRAAGPGGQNVNKVSSAVELRFDVKSSPSLPEWLRERVLARRDRRLTREGVLVLSAMRHRTQDRNRADARERLTALLKEATIIDPPRIATRPSRASQRRRVEGKIARGNVKALRGKVGDE